ncbi:MAG: hypothetical protein ABJ327_20840 [Litoreibacter sp.]
MSAMNSVAIVEGFRNEVLEDESKIKGQMAAFIKTTVQATVGVVVPAGMEDTDHYASLRSDAPQMTLLDLGIDHATTIDARVDAAADMLFGSYD